MARTNVAEADRSLDLDCSRFQLADPGEIIAGHETDVDRKEEPQHHTQTSPQQRGRGLFAKVKATVEILPENAHLRIHLHITVKNQRAAPLDLKRPYYLPKAEGIHAVKAWDESGDLTATKQLGRNAIVFREGATVAPDEEYAWTVEFECPGGFRRVGTTIAGVYTIKPATRFNNVKVTVHEFEYRFKFNKPRPVYGWPFHRIDVIVVPESRVRSSVRRGVKGTTATLSFPLRKPLRMIIASDYRRSPVPAVISALVTGLLASLVAQWISSAPALIFR